MNNREELAAAAEFAQATVEEMRIMETEAAELLAAIKRSSDAGSEGGRGRGRGAYVWAEIMAGYRWPDDMNALMDTYGLYWLKEDERPSTRQRLLRAIRWGWGELREPVR